MRSSSRLLTLVREIMNNFLMATDLFITITVAGSSYQFVNIFKEHFVLICLMARAIPHQWRVAGFYSRVPCDNSLSSSRTGLPLWHRITQPAKKICRTEVLGLMKAQNVKNTIIVPVRCQGWFRRKESSSKW